MKFSKDKLVKKFKNFKDQKSKEIAEVAYNIVREKDLMKKSNQYKKIVRELYPRYLNNYVQVCRYLHDDFNIHFANFNNEKTELKKELKLKKQVRDILKEYPDNKTKMLDRFNYNKNMKRWWVLSTILENYGDALKLLRDSSQEEIYKEIDINYELEIVKRDDYLIEDFSVAAI